MKVSIGIIAHNENSNIKQLLESLLHQKTKKTLIDEIIVVSSGSTDGTDGIISECSRIHKKIKPIFQEKRFGKASAINEFLANAKNDILVMISGDALPKSDALEQLCLPFSNKKIGIVASRPIPKNKSKNLLQRAIRVQWEWHHLLSLKNPKCGEMIAFRNVIQNISNTAADEEFISMKIKNEGYRIAYATNAVVLVATPKNVNDFIKQKRRIFWGHHELNTRYGYKVPSMTKDVISPVMEFLLTPKNFFPTLFLILLELYSRTKGLVDFYLGKEHYVWDIVESTKT